MKSICQTSTLPGTFEMELEYNKFPNISKKQTIKKGNNLMIVSNYF